MRRRTGPRTELLEPRLVLSTLRLLPTLAPADLPAGGTAGASEGQSEPFPGADSQPHGDTGTVTSASSDSPPAESEPVESGGETASSGVSVGTGQVGGTSSDSESPPSVSNSSSGVEPSASVAVNLGSGSTTSDEAPGVTFVRRPTPVDSGPAVSAVGSVTISDAAVLSVVADADIISVRPVDLDDETGSSVTPTRTVTAIDADVVVDGSRGDFESGSDADSSVRVDESEDQIERDDGAEAGGDQDLADVAVSDVQNHSVTGRQHRTESPEVGSLPGDQSTLVVEQQRASASNSRGDRDDGSSSKAEWIDGVAEAVGEWISPGDALIAGDGAEGDGVPLLAAGSLVPLLALARKTGADAENSDAKSSSDAAGVIDRKWWKDRRRTRPFPKGRRHSQRRGGSGRDVVVAGDGTDGLAAPDVSDAFAMSVMTPFNGDAFGMTPIEDAGEDAAPGAEGGLDASVGVGAGAAVATAAAAGIARQRAKRSRSKPAKPVISYSGTTREFPS